MRGSDGIEYNDITEYFEAERAYWNNYPSRGPSTKTDLIKKYRKEEFDSQDNLTTKLLREGRES